MLDGGHQLGQRAHAKLGLELSANIGDGLVDHMQMFSDDAVRLAFSDERQLLQLTHGHPLQRIGGPPRFPSSRLQSSIWLRGFRSVAMRSRPARVSPLRDWAMAID